MNTFKNAGNTLKGIVLGLALVVAGAYVYAWTGPTAVPPNGNVEPPINTSATAQAKVGALSLGGPSVVDRKLNVKGIINVQADSAGANIGIWHIDNGGTKKFFSGFQDLTSYKNYVVGITDTAGAIVSANALRVNESGSVVIGAPTNTTYKLYVDGATGVNGGVTANLIKLDSTALPTCDSGAEGAIRYNVTNNVGTFWGCVKLTANTYGWWHLSNVNQ